MLGNFFTTLKKQPDNDQIITRRRYSRRECDRVVSVIDGKTYPVENWSLGGLQIAGDERLFGIDQNMDITVKFKLRNDILNVSQKAHVVRKARNKISFEFAPLNQRVRQNFQQVVDDYVAQKFADSQMA